MLCAIVVASALLSAANGQGEVEYFQTPDQFLQRFLNTTSSQLHNFTDSFNVRNVTPADVTFHLHRLNNTPVELTSTNLHLIDPRAETKIVVHGWQANGRDEENNRLAGAYHKAGKYNFIAVDWSPQSRKNYVHASEIAPEIGALIGRFVLKLTNRVKGIEGVHLIGHSLGGHIAGFAGKYLKRRGLKLGRITGLDVAGPMFEVPNKKNSTQKLSKDDADFVDVIHTNAGFLGAVEPLGTADFYVENGGPIQPGCINLLNFFDSIACSHLKAFDHFKESVEGRKFEAVSCPNSIEYHLLQCVKNPKVLMGEFVPRNSSGVYYLETNSALPYSNLFPF